LIIIIIIINRPTYKVAAAGSPNYQLRNGALLPHVNRLRANRHRRDVNPSSTEYFNVTVTPAVTNHSTVGVTDVTSSSRDVTSRPTSPTTGYVRSSTETTTVLSLQTSTQNTSDLNVKTVSFALFTE